MSSMFDDFKEQVRSQANIVEISIGICTAEKRGSSYWAAVLFMAKKRRLFPYRRIRIFYCFGAMQRRCFYLYNEGRKLHLSGSIKNSGQ